jgi:GDP-L-fucose synthase
MELSAKIYVAGHRGLVGSALVHRLQSAGYRNIVGHTRAELDLSRQRDVERFFDEERPDYVFLAAARVGGIFANSAYPADFIYDNLAIQTNIVHAAFQARVQRLLFLGSSCIYPKLAEQPIREGALLTGPLEPTNRPYAVAKIAGIEMCWACNRQHGTRFLAAMPTNLYGPGDNYDLKNSHVIPAMIRKMHEAKRTRADHVLLWGTGKPRREFLHSDDAADACLFLMTLPEGQFDQLCSRDDRPPLINVGSGTDLTIRELAEMVAAVVGFSGQILFDPAKPDGAPRKLLDVGLLQSLGWKPRISLREGLGAVYEEFQLAAATPIH